MTADLSYTASQEEVPIVIFAHGFQGFKDWGPWPLSAEIFASKGFLSLNLILVITEQRQHI